MKNDFRSPSIPGAHHEPRPVKNLIELLRDLLSYRGAAPVLTARDRRLIKRIVLALELPHLLGAVERAVVMELREIAEKPVIYQHRMALIEVAEKIEKRIADE